VVVLLPWSAFVAVGGAREDCCGRRRAWRMARRVAASGGGTTICFLVVGYGKIGKGDV
jgi:uncharacterized membrane protein